MATSFSCVSPSPFRRSSPSNTRQCRFSLPASSNSWWTPLFGWSSDPDYINHNPADGPPIEHSDAPDSSSPAKQSKSRFSLGCFTEEKAKKLRMKTLESANFHDIMYHSAIASRLASDISDR